MRLDEATKQALDELKVGDHGGFGLGYAIQHELIEYGVDAVAHVYIFRDAIKRAKTHESVEDFLRRYGIFFEPKTAWKFCTTLEYLRANGLYFPKWAAKARLPFNKITFLSQDYSNKVFWHRTPEGKSEIKINPWEEELLYPHRYGRPFVWDPAYFENLELLHQGLRFGQHLWNKTEALLFEQLSELQLKVGDRFYGGVIYHIENHMDERDGIHQARREFSYGEITPEYPHGKSGYNFTFPADSSTIELCKKLCEYYRALVHQPHQKKKNTPPK
ncbi:MAG: hypothetical protein QW666_00295 [Candidatus Woesearchaeota archaeon]